MIHICLSCGAADGRSPLNSTGGPRYSPYPGTFKTTGNLWARHPVRDVRVLTSSPAQGPCEVWLMKDVPKP
jgi:hypothetical protein